MGVNRTTVIKAGIVVVWLILMAGLMKRDVFITSVTTEQQKIMDLADREEYQGIYFKDAKIGYVVNKYSVTDDNRLQVDQRATMRINVSNVDHQIDLKLFAELHSDYSLDSFQFSFDSPFYQMSAQGQVKERAVVFTLTTGSNTIENSLVVERAPMLPTARRAYLLREDLKEGDKMKIPSFDPVSLTAREAVVTYKGRVRELINGRVHNLHKFTEVYSGARINFWLDEQGDVFKEESPAGFVFLKEPKFKAVALDESSDELLSSVAIQVKGEMADPADTDELRYRLELPDEVSFELGEGRQSFADGILTVIREDLADYSQSGTDSCGGGGLEATPYVQADDPRIREQANRIVEGLNSDLGKVSALAQWVFENVEKRPVLGIPDARTTFDNRVGDCNEHAALFAALARSIDIPAHIAAGVVYHKKAFYYHAWNEVCVGGKWLSLDTTTNQIPADASHIRFLRGELDEQVRIGSLIGNLGIEVLPQTNGNSRNNGDG